MTETTRIAAPAPDAIRLFGATPDSIVDGPGLRYAVFVQGCTHGCPGCHNPESWAPDGGTLTSMDALMDDIRAAALVHDVTLSGGDPFDQVEASAELARRLKAEGYGLWTFTGYTYEDLLRIAEGDAAHEGEGTAKGNPAGNAKSDDADVTASDAADLTASDAADLTASDAVRTAATRQLLELTDVLVDGPYVESLRSLDLQWCGSSNQRLIDLAATRAAGHIVEWREGSDGDGPVLEALEARKPESW